MRPNHWTPSGCWWSWLNGGLRQFGREHSLCIFHLCLFCISRASGTALGGTVSVIRSRLNYLIAISFRERRSPPDFGDTLTFILAPAAGWHWNINFQMMNLSDFIQRFQMDHLWIWYIHSCFTVDTLWHYGVVVGFFQLDIIPDFGHFLLFFSLPPLCKPLHHNDVFTQRKHVVQQ